MNMTGCTISGGAGPGDPPGVYGFIVIVSDLKGQMVEIPVAVRVGSCNTAVGTIAPAEYPVRTVTPPGSAYSWNWQITDVDAVCATCEKLHGVQFSEPVQGLGNARTAALADGGLIGVRAPMHPEEEPVVRPYLLVDDIRAATRAAQDAGALIAHPPLEIPGLGTFAIYIEGGIHHGLWQV